MRMEEKPSYSTSEVAKFCHVTSDTIRKWSEAGRIHAFKTPGGHRRIRREDLIDFLRNNNIPTYADLVRTAMKVLIVDKDKSTVAAITRFLERTPKKFDIRTASQPFDVGHQLAAFKPDIVFFDLKVCEPNGLEICRRIPTMPEHEGVRMISMVPVEETDLARKTAEQGRAVCLKKPFTPDDLRKVLTKADVDLD